MKKILLIEDDPIIRENTAEILELANFKVHTASDGKEGCLLAQSINPDLIVCDIMMPKLDGFGVLHILAKNPKTATIPFIFLTAKAEKSDLRKGMELGADDYLTKPFDDTELLNAIEARFRKKDLILQEFSQNIESLNQFIDTARGYRELEDLSVTQPPVKYKKKQIIFNEGESPAYLYFLNKGKVKCFKSHEDGKEYITDIYKSGDFFGLPPLFEDKLYSDSALTLEDSEICKIPKKDFLALISKNKHIAGQFIKILSHHIEDKEKQLLSFAYDTVRKRTAEALLQLEKRYKSNDNAQTHIRITREDLASIAGTATETVIRCLSEFKDDQLIMVKGREIIILDAQGLADIRH